MNYVVNFVDFDSVVVYGGSLYNDDFVLMMLV